MEELNQEPVDPEAGVQQEKVELFPTELKFIKEIPELVDASTSLILQLEVSSTHLDIKPSGKILILDAQGEQLAEESLAPYEEPEEEPEPEFDPTRSRKIKPTPEELERVLGHIEKDPELARSRTAEFTLKAPATIGEYTWTARYVPEEFEEGEGEEEKTTKTFHQESSVDVSFRVRAHLITLSAWGAPKPVSRGESFTANIGACCSDGCSMAGLQLHIKTETGIQNVALGTDILHNTKATSWAEVTLQAPDDEEVHEWIVDCDLPESEHPHQIETATLIFRTSAPPQHTVTITIKDKYDEKKEMEEADVMLGRHQTVSNKQGIAVIKVPPGKQTLSVMLKHYHYDDQEIDVTGDMSITALMDFTPDF